jgi:5-methylcytosine-specific restriction protein B
MSTAPNQHWSDAEVEASARRVIDAGLGQGRSVIEPSSQAWTRDVAADLRHRVVDNADAGAGGFLTKLKIQLAGASRAAVLLAAELLYLQAVPLENVTAKVKRERIGSVLAWLQPPAPLPHDLDAALGAPGVFNGGVGFNVQIWRQIGWLLSFVEHWWSQPEQVRRQALGEPWAFRDVVASMPADKPGIRNSLLYLAFPRTFFPVVSQNHKCAIRDAFASLIGGASGKDAVAIDRDLAAIYARQAEHAGVGAVRWYESPYVAQWQKQTDESERAWLIRPRLGGGELVDRWRAANFVSLTATHLGEVPPGADRDHVRTAVESGYQHLDYAQRLALATEYHAFLSVMKVDDLVVTIADDQVHGGVIRGEPDYTAETDARLQRGVVWATAEPVPVSALAAPLPELLAQQGTVVDLTAARAVVNRLAQLDAAADGDAPEVEPPVPVGPPALPPATPGLASRLHLGVDWLQRIIDLLADRQQIVLYGPPGTGKTYLAREVARHLTDADAVRLVGRASSPGTLAP